MKQIIVNVSGLSVEEKQRVNEALAKITGFNKMTSNLVMAKWMYAPSSYTNDKITYSNESEPYANKEPTHTPRQVLEMAGMVTNRKVRKDFDRTKEYSVNVSGCTEEGKKEVQQAFFDVGMPWEFHGENYVFLLAPQYSNTTGGGQITSHCMHGSEIESCNMTAEEFLELVYEPEIKGHVHADLMALYAEDAKTTDKPWELWQVKDKDGVWWECKNNPLWGGDTEYRRKPKTHIVHGVEVPDLRFEPKVGEEYYLPYPLNDQLCFSATSATLTSHCHRVSNNLCYEHTEEGKQAAILHAKAMLGMVK